MTGQQRDLRGAPGLSLALAALAGTAVIFASVWMKTSDCWSAGFPSAGSIRALGVVGLVSAAAAMALGYTAGSRTRSGGALTASILAFVLGAVFAPAAIGLLLLAQAYPLCTDA